KLSRPGICAEDSVARIPNGIFSGKSKRLNSTNLLWRLRILGSPRQGGVIELSPPLRCAEQIPLNTEVEEDDTAWAERSEHWLTESKNPGRRRALRERSNRPLVLCGHGVLLRIEGGALTIRNGFTHYPQRLETYRFFKGELTIPPRIIMLDGSGSISFDV